MLKMNTSDRTSVTSLLYVLRETLTFHAFRDLREQIHGRSEEMDCDEVYPNIFIGNGATAKNKTYLKGIGVTHVLNTAEGNNLSMVDTNHRFYSDTSFKYLGLPLLDHPTTRICDHFNETTDFIDDALSGRGKVFVHCLMGLSRSSTCVIAYLMMRKGMTACEAIKLIKRKRAIHPNEGFLQQLADLDNKLWRERQ